MRISQRSRRAVLVYVALDSIDAVQCDIRYADPYRVSATAQRHFLLLTDIIAHLEGVSYESFDCM